MVFTPCPGLDSSRVLSNPNDSNSLTSRLTALRSRLRMIARPDIVGFVLRRIVRRTRMRSTESTRSKSAGSWKVTRSSGSILSPRSSFLARSMDRSTYSSSVPVVSVTVLTLLFIFSSPQFVYFSIETPGYRFVVSEFHRPDCSHEVPMVILVAVVVSKHPAIVHTTNPVIDVSETVAQNLAVLSLPHFFFQLRTLPWPSQHVFCTDGLRDRRLLGCFPSHHSSIAQMGS
jgi:hypothetical protein